MIENPYCQEPVYFFEDRLDALQRDAEEQCGQCTNLADRQCPYRLCLQCYSENLAWLEESDRRVQELTAESRMVQEELDALAR